jgi:DNA-binding CsgD family transcriptional regulator
MESEFSNDYFGNKLIHVDPCISHARRKNTPFTWAEVPFPEYGGVRKSGARRTMEVAGDHGYREGLIVPFHFSDSLGRINSSLVVFFWKDSLSRFYFTLSRKKYDMHLLMIYWAQRAVDLVGDQFHEGNRITVSDTVSEPDCRLTDRERDVLSWAARGKTAGDTAEILVLSEETVKTHIRNALTKLRAANKTHGVAKAIFLGLIDV